MKIGIITLFHDSKNYGGTLQAYALCKAINKMKQEIDVEQISYNFANATRIECILNKIKKYVFNFIKFFISSKRKILFINKSKTQAFECFKKSIPHSRKVFYKNNIKKSLNEYDIFITGSDQVWNPLIYDEVFRLDFVPSNKKKISYAASVSQYELSDQQMAIFKNTLADYFAISVREERAVELLEKVSNKKISYVLDPTLLLDKTDWEEVACDKLISENYIFCYFLSNDDKIVDIAKAYAKIKGVKIVEITSDRDSFADIRLTGIAPDGFISLIKYSDLVLTDSFHATVFSLIYQKQFFVFDRSDYKGMSSRIEALLSIFGLNKYSAISNKKFDLDYILQLDDIDYEKEFVSFEKMKLESFEFLKNAIE